MQMINLTTRILHSVPAVLGTAPPKCSAGYTTLHLTEIPSPPSQPSPAEGEGEQPLTLEVLMAYPRAYAPRRRVESGRSGGGDGSLLMVARSRPLRLCCREEQPARVPSDHQILISRDHPHRAGALRRGDDLGMRRVLLGVEVNT
jgi:hypothetical protein